jgi:periplasmic protein TonB
MQVGISSDEWVNRVAAWLREPISQSLLFSLALHLAFLLIFQPASGSSGQHIVTIEAYLQPMQTQSAVSLDSVDSMDLPDTAIRIPIETDLAPLPSEVIVQPTDELLTAISTAPVPPISVLSESVDVASDPEPTPEIKSALPQTTTVPVDSTAKVVESAEVATSAVSVVGSPPIAGLPSLPIAIDNTWYLARQVDVHPKAIDVIEPAYPDAAKRQNLEGSLKLMLKIDHFGRVTSAEVVEAVPPDIFDAAALAAFRDARFSPAIRDGRAVRYQAFIRVEFKLKD